MSNNPQFSIITICYNSEKTIEQTIKSVLTQTYKNYEYIIVDGASKDSTLSIVKKYEPLFEGRMKWKSEPDKGIYDAMNKGIERSIGDIIGIVNSDAWLETNALEIVSKAFESNERRTDTLYCGGINFVTPTGIKKWPVNLDTFKRQVKLYVVAGIRHPGVFVPKEVYNRINIFNSKLRISADVDFILRCYYEGINFYDMKAIISNMAEGGISTVGKKQTRQLFIEDRKEMLKGFGIGGLKFHWLMQSWLLRGKLRHALAKIGLYK